MAINLAYKCGLYKLHILTTTYIHWGRFSNYYNIKYIVRWHMIKWGVLTPTNGPRFKAPSFQWELEGFHGSLEVILWPRGFSTPPRWAPDGRHFLTAVLAPRMRVGIRQAMMDGTMTGAWHLGDVTWCFGFHPFFWGGLFQVIKARYIVFKRG